MNIPPELAGDLRLLSEVLDGDHPDIGASLSSLASAATLAAPSYLGLSVLVTNPGDAPLRVTTLQDGDDRGPLETSLRFALSGDAASSDGPRGIELTIYATQPGAFVDLAADLAWLTGRPHQDFGLDDDLVGPQDGTHISLTAWSTVNQARGLLMGGGLTVGEADAELDARARSEGTSRHRASADLLDGLSSPTNEL